MEPGEIAGRTVGTGVNVASGVGDGVIGASEGETGFGDGDFLGDGVGDAFDFFFPDDGFPFFFFAGVAFSLLLTFFSWARLLASDSAICLESATFRLPASPQMKPGRTRV